MVHGCMVYTERAEMAAVSCGTSHASAVSTPLRWIFKNALYKAVHSCRITWERSETARERRIALYKSDHHHHYHPQPIGRRIESAQSPKNRIKSQGPGVFNKQTQSSQTGILSQAQGSGPTQNPNLNLHMTLTAISCTEQRMNFA